MLRADWTRQDPAITRELEANGRDGINLTAAAGNSVTNNESSDNARDGLRIEGQSSGNVVDSDHMLGNGEHDCHDDTVGTGTAGTANVWTRDLGMTENRPGLCRNAEP